MKKPVFFLGKAFQCLSLLALPSAIWTAEFARNEGAAIGIFIGSVASFGAGYFLTEISTKFSGQ